MAISSQNGQVSARSILAAYPRLIPHPWIFLSALLIVVAFPPWGLTFLLPICIAPWFIFLRQTHSAKTAAAQGVWLSFFMTLGGYHWVAYVLQQFAHLSMPLAILGLFLFGTVCQPQFWIFGPLLVRLKLNRRVGLLTWIALGLFYTGMDWWLPKLWVDTLGHAFHQSKIWREAADLGGAWLLTFLVFAMNWVAADGFEAWKSREAGFFRRHRASLITVATLILAWGTYGYLRADFLKKYFVQPKKFRVAAIQANIGDFDKVAAEQGVRGAADKIVQTYLEMSDEALKATEKPDLIVWPETAYPSTFRTPATTGEKLRDDAVDHFVRTRQVATAFGGYDRDSKRDFNSFFLLTPRYTDPSAQDIRNEPDTQIYHKHVLLMFGETIPGMDSIEWLRNAFPQVGNFGRGPGPEVMMVMTKNPQAPLLHISPVICYEILFPWYAIEGARKGSQLIINITNDSWYGKSSEPYLHLALSTFRSLETRIPQFRATNTGITALIEPTGDIQKEGRLFEKEIIHAVVGTQAAPWTLMKAWGDWFGKTAFLLGIALLLATRLVQKLRS
ncbi:MAG: apolipoprotein N-acyltransferase [Bdellovibrionales bacterium]|nr:apolipoprotein N-acyltransferase [Bdellovibrionales bacterium]